MLEVSYWVSLVSEPWWLINIAGVNQQAVSGLAFTNETCYQYGGGCFTTYGFEYKPG